MPKGDWTTRTLADGTVQRKWTEKDVMDLDESLAAGMSDVNIAARLKRSVTAIQLKRKRMGYRSRRARLMTARTVARYMGWGCGKKTIALIHDDALKGRKLQRHRMWHVDEEDLIAFLKDPRYWCRWRIEDITHPAYRMWAQEFRAERYLSTGEVAAIHGVTHEAVNQWIRKGLLPAVRWQNWQVREADAKAFIPPCERSRKGRQRGKDWARAEKAALTRYRNQGMTFQAIGLKLGRSMESVANRWYRQSGERVRKVA